MRAADSLSQIGYSVPKNNFDNVFSAHYGFVAISSEASPQANNA